MKCSSGVYPKNTLSQEVCVSAVQAAQIYHRSGFSVRRFTIGRALFDHRSTPTATRFSYRQDGLKPVQKLAAAYRPHRQVTSASQHRWPTPQDHSRR